MRDEPAVISKPKRQPAPSKVKSAVPGMFRNVNLMDMPSFLITVLQVLTVICILRRVTFHRRPVCDIHTLLPKEECVATSLLWNLYITSVQTDTLLPAKLILR